MMSSIKNPSQGSRKSKTIDTVTLAPEISYKTVEKAVREVCGIIPNATCERHIILYM